jgi:hypothetical protein
MKIITEVQNHGYLMLWWRMLDKTLWLKNQDFASPARTDRGPRVCATNTSSLSNKMQTALSRLATAAFALAAISATAATTHYVNLNSPGPISPYTDWTTAATNIQDAINASAAGDVIMVTNGVYAAGGISMDGVITNRVSLNLPISVQSVNGPWVTSIQGAGMTNGTTAVRCAWLTNGASLTGFTILAGATRTSGTAIQAGGVWCYSSNATVANCIICSNAANSVASAAFEGTFESCAIFGNSCQGCSATYDCVLRNCTVVSNSVGNYPAVWAGLLTNRA